MKFGDAKDAEGYLTERRAGVNPGAGEAISV